jgi:hypothetical protein
LFAANLVVRGYADENKPFSVLPTNAAKAVSRPCSRDGVAGITGGWRPLQSDIDQLESRLPDISRLRSRVEDIGEAGIQIRQPTNYYRQYIGIVVGNRKLIYINAFSDPHPEWRTQVVDVCDSGPSEWGVLYDPVTGRFSSLRANGGLPPPPPPPPQVM